MILFPVLCDPLVNRCSYIQHINKTALSVIRELPTAKSNGHSPVFALLDFAVASKTIHYPLFLEDVSSLGSALQTSPRHYNTFSSGSSALPSHIRKWNHRELIILSALFLTAKSLGNLVHILGSSLITHKCLSASKSPTGKFKKMSLYSHIKSPYK